MRVSKNWLQEHLDFTLPDTSELVAKIGAQLGEVEKVTELAPKYKSIVVARVVTCERMENSDHLNVCRIDDGGVVTDAERGEDGFVQVVCGATNVRAGLLVAWLPPGSTVPSSFDTDPFVLSARPLRGVVSNGMLASAHELAVSDDHDGILELGEEGKSDLTPGQDFAEVFGLNDTIITIENKMFTHRPDCFGLLGVAREVAGIFGQQFASPRSYLDKPEANAVTQTPRLRVTNEIPELVPRFMAQIFEDIEVRPSNFKVQSLLTRMGIRPINNIVDITNLVMVVTGQPLHAYDFDKICKLDGSADASFTIRNPRDSERLKLLNGKTIDPRQDAILIASASQPIGLGGIMGGEETEVDSATKTIVLEAASFDMYAIRRSSMEHGLFSEAVTRFNKGQSPLQNQRVLAWAAGLLEAEGATAHEFIDYNALPAETIERDSLHPEVKVSTQFINSRLGLTLKAEEIAELLSHVECKVDCADDEIAVSAPFWRTDIELREDLVEEIGRLYGYDNVPQELPSRRTEAAQINTLMAVKTQIRHALSAMGAQEALTYSFVHGKTLQRSGQNPDRAFKLSNALSPDLQYVRLSGTPSLLDKVHANIKQGYGSFVLFELGRSSRQGVQDLSEPEIPAKQESVTLLVTADSKRAQTYAGAPFYQAKHYVETLLKQLHIKGEAMYKPLADATDVPQWLQDAAGPFEPKRSAVLYIDGAIVGVVGEFQQSVRKALKLPDFTAGFELDTTSLCELEKETAYQPLSRFPGLSQDICLRVDQEVSFETVSKLAAKTLAQQVGANQRVRIDPIDIFQKAEEQEHKQITLRVTVSDSTRTLTDEEVTGLLDAVAFRAQQNLGAERI